MDNFNSGQFLTAEEAINSLLSREDDLAGKNKLKYGGLVKDVFTELNLSSIKITKRILVTIDPYLRSIDIPSESYKVSTIMGVGHHGRLEPLVYNSKVEDDIVDVGLDKNCNCNCTDAICNYQKSYETITEDIQFPMPNGILAPFTKIIRKYINQDGSVYMEVTEPVAGYVSGVHTTTTLVTTPTLLCKLEMKECGCVKDNSYNRNIWGSKASSVSPGFDQGILCEWGVPNPNYYPRSSTYNISDDGTRIIFPHDFPYKKVMLRYYAFQSTKNILIPQLAKEAVLCGIKRYETKYDKTAPKWLKDQWKADYNAAVTNLQLRLSSLMLNEFYEYFFGRNSTEALYYNSNYEGHSYSYQ